MRSTSLSATAVGVVSGGLVMLSVSNSADRSTVWEFVDFRSAVVEVSVLLRCDNLSLGNWFPTFYVEVVIEGGASHLTRTEAWNNL
jgi:hypothetical protein